MTKNKNKKKVGSIEGKKEVEKQNKQRWMNGRKGKRERKNKREKGGPKHQEIQVKFFQLILYTHVYM